MSRRQHGSWAVGLSLLILAATMVTSCTPLVQHPGMPAGLSMRLAENYPERDTVLGIPIYARFSWWSEGRPDDLRLEAASPFILSYPYTEAGRYFSGGDSWGLQSALATVSYRRILVGVFWIGSGGKVIFAVPQKIVRRDDYAYAWRFQYAFMSSDWRTEILAVSGRREYAVPRENGRFWVPPEMFQCTGMAQFRYELNYGREEQRQTGEFLKNVKLFTDPQHRTGNWLDESFQTPLRK